MHWLVFTKRWQYITKLANVSAENQQAQAQTPNSSRYYVCSEEFMRVLTYLGTLVRAWNFLIPATYYFQEQAKPIANAGSRSVHIASGD